MKRTLLAIALVLLMLSGISVGVAEEAPIASLSHMHPEELPADVPVNSDDVESLMAQGEAVVQSLSEGLMALGSGRVSAFVLFEDTAHYIAAQNPQYEVRDNLSLRFTMHMVAGEKNAALIGQINEAMEALRAQGALDTLWQLHVTDVIDGQTPQEIALPTFAGAQTLRVGVSGDCPPMDYVSAAGTPMGYNMALLAALAERMAVNLEIVSVESGARFAALGAGTIDLFFWQVGVIRDERMPPALFDTASDFYSIGGSVIASEPYGEQGMALLVLKGQ